MYEHARCWDWKDEYNKITCGASTNNRHDSECGTSICIPWRPFAGPKYGGHKHLRDCLEVI
jgi:hypothetical protein